MEKIFLGLTLFTAVILIFVQIYLGTKMNKNNIAWKTLPREKILGIILAAISFSYSGIQAKLMLEGSLDKLRNYTWVFVLVAILLMFFVLDYVFARGLGIIIVILGNHLMHDAMVLNLPYRAIFSVICYFWGIVGLFWIGMPYLFRNLLKNIAESKKWKIGTIVALFVTSLSFLIMAILTLQKF